MHLYFLQELSPFSALLLLTLKCYPCVWGQMGVASSESLWRLNPSYELLVSSPPILGKEKD